MQSINKFKGLILAGLLIALVVVGSFVQIGQAAPPAAPTPVADFLMPLKNASAFPFQAATALTADTNTTAVEVMNMSAVDVSYTIDISNVNTTTLKIQYSNDNTNWVDGLTLGSAVAADGSALTRVPVFGRYMRINQDVATADAITITLLGVGR